MMGRFTSNTGSWIASLLIPVALFWSILSLGIPYSFSQYFHSYSLLLFLIILVFYYFFFRLPEPYGMAACLSLTMALVALSLSYIWTSGFSDNFLISGLVPYKDAKNYFAGANLLLNGFPLVGADQATERPLFPSFLSTLLLFTGQNLKVTLAILAQMAAIGIYFSARQVWAAVDALAASLFSVFLYFYIQPILGYSMSEMLGFTAGCFGFAMLLISARHPKWYNLVPGMLVLMVAVSARAGTFFIFPLLALWVGWIFRGEKHFSIKLAFLALLGVSAAYVLVNSLYARVVGIPPGYSFGNFSYALYGQVRGGTGWHSAIEELGTRDPSIVYREAWQFFVKHPVSLFIGFAKSYRDFFLLSDLGVFPFREFGLKNWLNSLLWLASLGLMTTGLFRSWKDRHNNLASLIVVGFIGIFLSIPFLPPIDGGARFYAATVPYFFILPALGVSGLARDKVQAQDAMTHGWGDQIASQIFSIAILVAVLLIPPVISRLSAKPIVDSPLCPDGQESFFIRYGAGSYVDLVKDEISSCGSVPEICQSDFEKNNTEKSVDDFYQLLLTSMKNDKVNVRLIPAIDFVEHKFHYFYMPLTDDLSPGEISGCAVEVLTRNQTIYQVESWSPKK